MSHGAGAGDKLARGAIKASFQTTEGNIKQSAWDKMFKDFDPEKFKREPNKSSVRKNPDVETSGDASANARSSKK